ncbi:MAG: cupin domain-containing protein [Caldilineaceae bacterium]|nr:cupin domain-containing protein [Caldilineaceae bacterium]
MLERHSPSVHQIYHPWDGEVLTIGGVSVTIKVSGTETAGAFALYESIVPPHFAGSPAHLHLHATATFYMVSGVLAFTLAEETVMVRQGGIVRVPPGLLHKFWNPTATPATYLTYLSPAGFEQYFVELAALMANEATWPPADASKVTALHKKYELLPTATPVHLV